MILLHRLQPTCSQNQKLTCQAMRLNHSKHAMRCHKTPSNQMPHALIVPTDEPVDELHDYKRPIAMVLPEPASLRHS